MSTGIVILAAGESARMGAPKQLLTYQGTPLLQHAVNTALALDLPLVVVLGAHAAQIKAHLNESRLLIVENPDWSDGMGGSVCVGLNTLLAEYPEINAVIFMLCDQPLLTASTLSDLIAEHQRNGFGIVASEYGGTLGVPALFAREFFPELLALHSTGGAQQIILKHQDRTAGIPFPGGRVDLDTPADYQSLNELPTPV